jgi:creatinine amidohydrolase
MLFKDLSWMDVQRYLERDDRVVVIIGSCEQHGYLSLLTDVSIPVEVARQACDKEGVLIAPPLPFGVSPYFKAYPGTLSLRPETFASLVRELLEELLGQGFQRILVNNGHGGNAGLLDPLLIELSSSHPDARMRIWEWFRQPAVAAVARNAGLQVNHANWAENFPFTRVGSIPEEEKQPVDVPSAASATHFRDVLGDGSFGGRYQASDEVMDRMLTAAVDAMTEVLREL